jgi:SAM-dependent methyltransferase
MQLPQAHKRIRDGERVPDIPARAGSNLQVLLEYRFAYLKDHLAPKSRVLEVGAGPGHVATFVSGVNIIQTDVGFNPWLHLVTSGEKLPFADASFDAVIAIAVLHHLDFPARALSEFARVIKPGGKLLILEAHNSWLLRMLLTLRSHEYVDNTVDPFGENSCQRDDDAWDGNNAVGDLLFEDKTRLKDEIPEFTVIHHQYGECLLFMNSGGVNHRAPYIPLPRFALKGIAAIDRWLCHIRPNVFALVQEVVLRRD